MTRSTVLLVSLLLMGAADDAQTTREVSYSARSVVRVNAKLRFTTMIILPEQEEILDYVCGDKDFWIISGTQNLAYVKPAKAATTTNLNLVTASGHVYSFLLTEGAADELDPVWWTSSEGRIRCPEWDHAKRDGARGDSSRTSSWPAPSGSCWM
ncbi:MAG TPA: TrbG/VirB9 family P-type conjugative transfer protein, partial [Vicinamibacterales bacterium]|nr:TrbG/VirB9 family P-type conjugative transfer protein [Vicinamibacterales bacterium]